MTAQKKLKKYMYKVEMTDGGPILCSGIKEMIDWLTMINDEDYVRITTFILKEELDVYHEETL